MSVKWIIVYIMTKFMILFINHYAILSKELKVSQSYQYNTQFALEDAFLEADVLIGWLNPPFKGYIGMSLSNKCKNAMYTTAQSPHTSIFEDILAITSLLSLQSPQTIHHVIFFLFFLLEVLFYLAMVDWDFHLSCMIAYLCLETYCCCCC